ncbi:MAG: hypothetical protein CMN87_15495 [Stappia sp.]|uniref:hypothetical protein n=1 Tax=Stappia sp. TaxID=1870903 RepID=UPI000C616E57|nr:hypothetical protein [Stappia sp.]MAA97798.1 hypothetical protein [Stappia sp.]MBM21409.1 hypothetical protein [Stappia sp.]|tara:strand:- start:80 stop:349 length:270 start_codon:yes stop_codon:yes gene_type:complete
MLSDDLRDLHVHLECSTEEDGSLILHPLLARIMLQSLRDLSNRAASLEASQVNGPARLTEADLASGKVARLPIVPRPVRADNDERGPAA